MRKLLLLLLLPGLLWAQEDTKIGSLLTVKTPKTTEQPVGTIDRVSKRTLTSLTFESDAIGSGKFQTIISTGDPLCWDSSGTMKRIDLSEKQAKTKGYQKAVKIAGSFIEYDSLGNIRYEKGGQVLDIKPAFTGIKMYFEPMSTQMKATYYIDKDITLAWKLIDPYRMAARKIAAFTAKDAADNPVDLVEVRTDTSLSVRIKDAKGVTWPVAIDPTINDTIRANSSAIEMTANAGSWAASRNAYAANSATLGWLSGYFIVGHNGAVNYRSAITMPLTHWPVAGTIANVDSVRLFIEGAGNGVRLQPIRATTSGKPDVAWYNDFKGWPPSDSLAYTVTPLTESYIQFAASGWVSGKLTSAAIDTASALKARGDSLRIMLLGVGDIAANTSTTGAGLILATNNLPYWVIYYTDAYPPGVSTIADSSRAAAILVGEIDSTGGTNCTSRGFQWWTTGDTTTISKSGSFGIGEYQDTTKALPIGAWIHYRAFATQTKGTSYGAVDSFSTGNTSSTEVWVDGRRVDHVR